MFAQRDGLMGRRTSLAAIAAVAIGMLAGSASAATIFNASGNGQSGFGGVLGTGQIAIDNDATGALNFTFTKGTGGNLNDAVVIYLASGTAQGFSSTANFSGTADGLRRAISGYDGSTRSTLNFSGMSPNYAIAFDQNFGGLWQLAEGGSNSLPFSRSVGLTPTGTATSATYSFSLNVSDIGLTANSGQSFRFFATYLNPSNVFRSNEAFGDGFGASNPGAPSSVTMTNSLAVVTVPEPAMAPLVVFGLVVPAVVSYRRMKRKSRTG